MTRFAKLPEITQPSLTNDQKNLRTSLHSIIETIQIREGKKGDILDKNVTLRELVSSGIVKIRKGGISLGNGVNVDLVKPEDQIVLTKPPKPTGVFASPGFDSIRIGWDAESTDYGAHAYAEIWRHTSDNIAQATLSGRAEFFTYSDNVDANTQYYYWVRFVSVYGVKGEFHAAAGIPAKTFVDPEKVLESLTDKIQTNHLAEELRDPLVETMDLWTAKVSLDEITAGIGLWIDPDTSKSWCMVRANQFAFINPTDDGEVVPFYIDGNNIFMDTALIKTAAIKTAHIESLDVEKIVGDKAAFIHANIDYAQVGDGVFSGTVSSQNYGIDMGWQISPNGQTVFNQAVIRGDVYADNGYFRGDITGASGTFSGYVKADKIIGDVVTAKLYPVPAVSDTRQEGNVKLLKTIQILNAVDNDRVLSIEGLKIHVTKSSNTGSAAGGRIKLTGSFGTKYSPSIEIAATEPTTPKQQVVGMTISIPANTTGSVNIYLEITEMDGSGGTVTLSGVHSLDTIMVNLFTTGSDLG